MKLLIASIIVFSVIILFLFALFPSTISVTRLIETRTSKEKCKKEITDLRTWTNWNSLLIFSTDSAEKPAVDIPDSTGLSIGGVTISLEKANKDTITTVWQHNGKKYKGAFVITETGGRSIIEWTFFFHLQWYPWDKLSGMFYDKELGPQMEKSLIRLRTELEK